tara:strand:+ start:1668 stop:2549 length:882 start_codon:yes stop_codon:yes gene_type:complete
MKTFRGYLKERAPAWQQSLSIMLFDLPRAGLSDLKIPLSPSIFKRIWPESVRSRMFHLTDHEGIKKLIKMQGGKKSISAFYNMEASRLSYGIQTEGGYVAELDADVLVAAPDDIASQPDKTGRRWLVWSTILDELGGGNRVKGMESHFLNLLETIIHEYTPEDIGKIERSRGIPQYWSSFSRLLRVKGTKKELSLVIRDYIDGMEKIMKTYSKPLRSIFTDYVKTRIRDEEEQTGTDWDELVVNNFKIKEIHVGSEYADDWKDDKDIYGFPFETWDYDEDLANYISQMAKRGK